MKKFLSILLIICLLLTIFTFIGCSSNTESPEHQHRYMLKDYQPMTCTQDEVFTYGCVGCNDEYSKPGRAAQGHSFDEYDVCIHCGGDKIVTGESEEYEEALQITLEYSYGTKEYTHFLVQMQDCNLVVPLLYKRTGSLSFPRFFVIYVPIEDNENYTFVVEGRHFRYQKYIEKLTDCLHWSISGQE